ncbi:hypothetical protein CYMTET_31759 [Cymbomonas tetramitiformis]|uniref:Right handed beta helix domain-containing protein n=1 Tax=Cymbomonas tetramitiformis TaxID=36881 RepID=A0AAE0FGN4_9CHLO|nr:hypothetical protein CYMTET_31759 [Cymbomonas tetramitiformis]
MPGKAACSYPSDRVGAEFPIDWESLMWETDLKRPKRKKIYKPSRKRKSLGGIYGVGATIVVRGTSRVADNEAKVDGGGVCVVGYGTLEMDASSVTGNRAAGNGGGFAVSTGSEAALRNGAVLERNHGGDGGGVAVSEGRISIVDSAVRVNTAHGTASGVLLYGGAEMEVEGSRFELHPGSALKVVGEAQATELQIIELQWQRETKAVCIGATIFLLMIVYPGISTNMFQLFNCEGVAFDDEDLLTQMWLRADTASECSTTRWWLAVAAAMFTLATYVLGFPMVLFVSMRRLRSYQKVRMPRQVADRHVDLVQQGVWIPCSENDVLAVQLSSSFHHLKLEELRPRRFSWYQVWNLLLAKKGSLRGEETMMPSPAPEKGILVEAGTEEKATGLEGEG